MCVENQSNSISMFQLSLPLIFFSASILNIVFLIRHWSDFEMNDEEILRTIVIFLFLLSHSMASFIAYIFSENLIFRWKFRILFIVLSSLSLVRIYTFFYQKMNCFGVRLKSIEYKFAVVDFSIEVCHFLFKYSMQYIIYIPLLMQNSLEILDFMTVGFSAFVLVMASILLVLKAFCLMYFDEQEDHWIKRIVFLGVFPFGFGCDDARNYYEADLEQQSWTTDYQ